MGLLFQTPVEVDQRDDRVIVKDDGTLRLRSYGLPMVFWVYLLAIFAVIFFMGLAIKNPLIKALAGEDKLNIIIAGAVIAVLIAVPFTLLALYFYEKEILKKKEKLTVTHRIFFVPIKSKTFILKEGEDLIELEHFFDSPNIAAQEKKAGMAAFENRGYFKLVLKRPKKKPYLIDRNSRRAEMRKLKELLESY